MSGTAETDYLQKSNSSIYQMTFCAQSKQMAVTRVLVKVEAHTKFMSHLATGKIQLEVHLSTFHQLIGGFGGKSPCQHMCRGDTTRAQFGMNWKVWKVDASVCEPSQDGIPTKS